MSSISPSDPSKIQLSSDTNTLPKITSDQDKQRITDTVIATLAEKNSSPESTMSRLLKLPDDLLLETFKYLPVKELVKFIEIQSPVQLRLKHRDLNKKIYKEIVERKDLRDVLKTISHKSEKQLEILLHLAQKAGEQLRRLTLCEFPITDEQFKLMCDNCLNLENITIVRCNSLTNNCLGHLPKQLKHLAISDNSHFTDEGLTELPISLTSLSISHLKSFSGLCLTRLSNLQSLDVLNFSSFNPEYIKNLPIQKLQVRGCELVTPLIFDYFKGLIHLDIGFNYKTKTHTIFIESIQKLPLTLTFLSISSEELTDETISYLPTNLLHLDIRQHGEEISKEGIKNLPPQLEYLSIPKNEQLDDSSIAFLPQTLHFLNLRSNEKITSQSFAQLPRQLTSLNLQSCKEIQSGDIQFLPANLAFLNLYSASLTDEAIKDLPRGITHLILTQSLNLTDKCIPDLPPKLRIFDNNWNLLFTPAGIALFPKTLHTLLIEGNGQFETKDYPTSIPNFKVGTFHGYNLNPLP